MNENEIKKVLANSDNALPDAALLTRTQTAMNGASRPETKSVEKFRRPAKVMFIAAALVLSLAVLMSAGYVVFEYVYYVPGGVIIIDEYREADVFVLDKATKLGGSYIETAAITPNKDGTRTLMLWYGKGGYSYMGEWTPDKITAVSDGVEYTLTETKRSDRYKIFKCTNYGGGENFTVSYLDGSTVELELECIDQNKFAEYEYPVYNGVTVVMFPLSQGSNVFTYTVRCDFADGNLKSLAEASNYLSARVWSVKITDILGNEYFVPSYSSSSYFNPLTELYVTENFCYTEQRPVADIACIEIDKVIVKMEGLDFSAATDITVPEYDVSAPIGKPLFNAFSVTDDGATAILTRNFPRFNRDGEVQTAFQISYNSMPSYDFIENVNDMMIFYKFQSAGGKEKSLSANWNSESYTPVDGEKESGYSRLYYFTEDEGFDSLPGDIVQIIPEKAYVILTNDWNIDISSPVK